MSSAGDSGNLSDRVARLRESLLRTTVYLSCERLKFLREAYEEAAELPAVAKRALVFGKVLRGMTIFIDENPIVGTLTGHRLGVLPYPEASCDWMTEGKFKCALGDVEIMQGERHILAEAVAYWRERCVLTRAQEAFREQYGSRVSRDECQMVGIWADQAQAPRGRIVVDYGKVLNQGLRGVRRQAEDELAKLRLGYVEDRRARHFLKAVIGCCDAVIAFAHRYASQALRMAEEEARPERRRELEAIAQTCLWVPENPARTFREAIQSFWFIHLAVQIETSASGVSPGRFPQYMFPFYAKDRRERRVTEDEALELLELLFIKFTETGLHFQSGERFKHAMGNRFQNISLGGVARSGDDATNDIDFLLVEAQKRLRLFQPTLSVLYHKNLSDEFLLKAVESVRTGIGMPAFFNSDVNVQGLLSLGSSLEDARDHAVIGCVERGWSHCQNNMAGGDFNMAKVLELALNNGRDPVTQRQIGPRTGDATGFRTYQELHDATRRQLEHFLPPFLDFVCTAMSMESELCPKPFASSLVDDCIKRHKDIVEGGSRYSQDGRTAIGTVDLANSLAAIKKVVFDEGSITMAELLRALEADFEGFEELQRKLLDAPKYGNDDDYVDSIAKEWFQIFWQEHYRIRGEDHLGRMIKPNALSVTRHFPMGAATGALPSGRKARMPLTDASVSPMPGTDTNGPTALVRSATRVLDTVAYSCGQLNMKFHPSVLASAGGMKRLLALIRTYMDLGGHHIQFNVVSSDTLRDAQSHPDKYPDLLVRVAGFSAFFIHLDPAVQREIMKRTELAFD